MYSSLYYPHTRLGSTEFAKTALLLWDKVHYIGPYAGFRPRYEDPVLAEAAEILTVEHVPSEAEKQAAHWEIKQLVDSKPPEWFMFTPENPNLGYLSYDVMPEKLWPETWEMLLDSQLVQEGSKPSPSAEYGRSQDLGYELSPRDYVMTTSLGLTIMSILAAVCAGQEKKTVTDESDNYAALTRYFATRGEGTYGDVSLASNVASEAARLVTISLKTLSGRAATLKDLIELRKREESERSPFLWTLRRKYFDELDEYIKRLQSIEKEGDKDEIEREFEVAMENDLKELQRELRLESWRLLFSKEMLGAVAVAAGAVVEPVTTATIGIALLPTVGLWRVLHDYGEIKRDRYESHTMSWLYQVYPSRVYG